MKFKVGDLVEPDLDNTEINKDLAEAFVYQNPLPWEVVAAEDVRVMVVSKETEFFVNPAKPPTAQVGHAVIPTDELRPYKTTTTKPTREESSRDFFNRVLGGLSVLLIALTMVACGFPEPDYTTKHGINVYLNGSPVPKHHVETATKFYIERMYGAEYDTFGGVSLGFSDVPLKCGDSLCAGVQQGQVIWVAWPGSLCVSALFHEFTHYIHGDPSHKDKDLWQLESDIRAECAETFMGKL